MTLPVPDWREGTLPGVGFLTDNPDDLPRGIRNANPGNIKASDHFVWRGQVGRDVDGYAKFTTAFWGVRAMAVILAGYVEHHGLVTIAQCINRWSPDSPEIRRNYAYAVAAACECSPDDPVDLLNLGQPAITAMISFENSCWLRGVHVTTFYRPEVIRAAVGAAHKR